MLNRIRTVLIHNSHPGNIGSAARALKNMSLSNLYLVAPKRFPAKEAFYMAASAADLVENAKVLGTVNEALEGCSLVFGTSSRTRSLKWPVVSPSVAAQKIVEELKNPEAQIAILYGCEQSGLTNEELEKTNYQIIIPADPIYSSLNLAQAVLLISYEIYKLWAITLNEDLALNEDLTFSHVKEAPYATHEELERFYVQLEALLLKVNFLFEDKPSLLMPRLRRFFNGARPDKIELQILRGILTAFQKRV
jgi:tRNA (cytidine32/uridine32-2'-O)-methyltransferase